MSDTRKSGKQPENREDRLRAALRANLARRKAQARARAEQDEPAGPETGESEGDE